VEEDEDGWKTRAPGLKRGAQLSGGKLAVAREGSLS
jgi:hypothetical protein